MDKLGSGGPSTGKSEPVGPTSFYTPPQQSEIELLHWTGGPRSDQERWTLCSRHWSFVSQSWCVLYIYVHKSWWKSRKSWPHLSTVYRCVATWVHCVSGRDMVWMWRCSDGTLSVKVRNINTHTQTHTTAHPSHTASNRAHVMRGERAVVTSPWSKNQCYKKKQKKKKKKKKGIALTEVRLGLWVSPDPRRAENSTEFFKTLAV